VIVIDAQGLKASRPNRPLFADVSLTLSDGDRVGVVGLNGCGKSTLLRIISGEQEPEAGVVRRGRNARVGVLSQAPVLPKGTVREAVGGTWQGEAMLDRLGMSGLIDSQTDQLSGGQKKRVALAGLLIGEWEALILDEPTNHLDLDAIAYLEEWLANYNGGLLLVTHDRHVLDRVTTKVLEIDRGKAYLHVPTGWSAGSGYAAYLSGRSEREEQAATAEQVRKNLAKTELAWLRRGAPARTTKAKARVASATALVNTKAEAPARQGELGLTKDLGSKRLGSKGVELHGVGFSWPNGKRVLSPFDHMLEPGDRLGIVGPNGAGKSTLLDLISERLTPTEGKIDIGRTVKIGYYDQLGRDLDVTKRVRDAVAGDKGAPSLEDINLMKRFWFDGDSQFAEISTLSGGERRRLQLLLTLIEQPNVLLLDEPTNDLDLDTLRALEDFLDDWPGLPGFTAQPAVEFLPAHHAHISVWHVHFDRSPFRGSGTHMRELLFNQLRGNGELLDETKRYGPAAGLHIVEVPLEQDRRKSPLSQDCCGYGPGRASAYHCDIVTHGGGFGCGSGHLRRDERRCLRHVYAFLLSRVTEANRYGSILQRLVVHRDAERSADLVLAAIPLSDGCGIVILHGERFRQFIAEFHCGFTHAAFFHQRQHSSFYGSDLRG
jgi:ATP-binding cassette subfamily F protein uup